MINKGYPIKATFIDEITYDIPTQNWSDEQWVSDFDNMQDVGIDTVVIMRSCFYDKCLYPSKIFPSLKEENEDFLKLVFSEAEKRKMKVYLGMYISNLCWNEGDALGEIKKNGLFVREALERYGDYSSFEGWYIPHETGFNDYSIKETMGGLVKLCKDKTPGKKIFISPFFKGEGVMEDSLSPERTEQEWDKIWEFCGNEIDVCAFQDGTAKLSRLGEYLQSVKRVCDKYKISLWSNVETFERDVRSQFYPIPFDVLRKKIEIARPIADNMITFEFSHFLSPQSMYLSARNLNSLYKKYYGKTE